VTPKEDHDDKRWFGVMKIAHELGLITTALMVISFLKELRNG